MRLLVRREHGAQELANKLVQRGYSQTEVNEIIAECQRLDLQNDARFAACLCHARIRQGYGPIKISHELKTKQIDRELIQTILEQEEDNWFDYALAVWHKKYKNQVDIPFNELQKRQRFLLYRGFPSDIIARLIKEINYNDETL